MVRSAEISCSKQFKMQRAGILKSLAFLCALVNLQVLVTSEIDIDFEISGDNAYPLFIGVAPDEKLIKSKAPPHAVSLNSIFIQFLKPNQRFHSTHCQIFTFSERFS